MFKKERRRLCKENNRISFNKEFNNKNKCINISKDKCSNNKNNNMNYTKKNKRSIMKILIMNSNRMKIV